MNKWENTSAQEGFATSAVVALLMTVFFIGALGFGMWAFAGKQENQTNLDEKIATASAVAVQEAESAKDVEFAEELKNPFNTFTGRETYGALTFDYPKTWSVFVERADRNTILNFYGHPDEIPGIDRSISYAFRAQIVSSSYDKEIASFNSDAERGDVKVEAFRPKNVPDVLGAKVTGEVANGKFGTLVLMPQRDKTIYLWTEQEAFEPDFEKVLESLSFVP